MNTTVVYEPSDREVRLNEIIYQYELAHDNGAGPAPDQWVAEHPEFEPELREYLESRRAFTDPDGQWTPQAGDQLGDYILIDRLGRGGEGTVFRARHRLTDHVVALKLVRAGADAGERIQEETRVLSTLRHPNIVQPHFYGEHEGIRYFTMVYMEGGSLQDHIDLYRTDRTAAITLLQKVARAIHYAHSRGILHLDLKPANILLDDQNEPRVSDFGLAQRLKAQAGAERAGGPAPADPGQSASQSASSAGDPSDPRSNQTWSRRQIRGTAPYMSPEMASTGATVLTTAADVYGLGALLYAMLTGRPPFQGKSVADTLHLVVHDPPIPPRALNPKVSRELQAVCLKCLSKDPAQRYGSADGLANDLGRWLRDEPTVAGGATVGKQVLYWLKRHPYRHVGVGMMCVAIWLAGIVGSLGEARRATEKDAQILARQTSSQFEMIQRAVGLVAGEPELKDMLARLPDASDAQRQGLDQFLAKASQEFNYRFGIVGGNPLFNVFIMNEKGILLADTFARSTAVGRDFSRRDYFESLMGSDDLPTGAVIVSRTFRSIKDGLWKVPVSTRIWGSDGKTCLGVLVANVATSSHLVVQDMRDAPSDSFISAPIDWNYAETTVANAEQPKFLAVLERSYPRADSSMLWPDPDDFPALEAFSEQPGFQESSAITREGSLLAYHRVGQTPLVAVVTRIPRWQLRLILAQTSRNWLLVFLSLATLALIARFVSCRFSKLWK